MQKYPRRCSVKEGVLRNFTKFTGKHLWLSLSFIKVVKNDTLAHVFSCEFCEIYRKELHLKFDVSKIFFLIFNNCSKSSFLRELSFIQEWDSCRLKRKKLYFLSTKKVSWKPIGSFKLRNHFLLLETLMMHPTLITLL